MRQQNTIKSVKNETDFHKDNGPHPYNNLKTCFSNRADVATLSMHENLN